MSMRRSTNFLLVLLLASGALHLALIFLLPVVLSHAGAPAEAPLRLTLHLRPQSIPQAAVAIPRPDVALPASPALTSPDLAPPKPAVSVQAPPSAANPALPLPMLPAADDDYLRRSQLTVPAEPLGLIVIPDPGVDLGTGVKSMTLTLFINETGRVDRIAFDAGNVPAAMAAAARKAFAEARFSPGQLNGLAVKSRMRVEVSLEATRTAF